jgi:hypothetical protein
MPNFYFWILIYQEAVASISKNFISSSIASVSKLNCITPLEFPQYIAYLLHISCPVAVCQPLRKSLKAAGVFEVNHISGLVLIFFKTSLRSFTLVPLSSNCSCNFLRRPGLVDLRFHQIQSCSGAKRS